MGLQRCKHYRNNIGTCELLSLGHTAFIYLFVCSCLFVRLFVYY